MDKFSYVGNSDVVAIEALYNQFLKDPNSVDKTWQDFFKGFEFARTDYSQTTTSSNTGTTNIPENVAKEFAVINLINGYRTRGHLFTKTNPVRKRRKYKPDLGLDVFELEDKDLETVFHAGTQIQIGDAKLKDIVAHLERTYCQSIGVEYMFIRNPNLLTWLQERMETSRNIPKFDKEQKRSILKKVTEAVTFENFLATKFVGQKRFSLEGAESFLPAMNALMEHGAELGIEDYIIGMAHRGRLNVLANIMNKPTIDIFTEFEGRPSEDGLFDGDVKYHMGYSNDVISESGKSVHVSLTPNPSHLETVAPVVEGITRAKIDGRHKGNHRKACPIIVHGDAAIAGQGVVYEVVQMAHLDAYKVGGTVHFIINNQVGFTTNYRDARSSTYCTDVAKVTKAPVFHVNGDDVEALTLVAKMAIEFRLNFRKDVFIDILCYRKYGHNEGDEPRFTQPLLYREIAKHPNPKEIYAKKLIEEGSFTQDEIDELEKSIKSDLEKNLESAKKVEKAKVTSYLQGPWQGVQMASDTAFDESPVTAIGKKTFLDLAQKTTELPKDKKFFNKTERLFNDRRNMIKSDTYDWAMGELLAYASLMTEGHRVRFSGQDVERGTFSHRHAVITMEDSEEEYVPLNNIGAPERLEIYNSHLSEYAVLGFEYGYAYASPNALTIWEAQFGDFFNGAQIIIDQYLSSSEYKWRRMNGLVVLLPHGYEGQGPEHSSARVERFLQMCAENNMQIVNATTPAQQFHALRRQLKRGFRKPLICFTPKKLLRYPTCVSGVKDFTEGKFQELIDDISADVKKITRVAFCSGKIYYDLIERREKEGASDIAFIRLEQLYPFPQKQVDAILAKYKNAKEYLFVQEESENMGAWRFVDKNLRSLNMRYVGRDEAASPATGFAKRHAAESEEIMLGIFSKVLVK
ncbi:2-oxoglutarate dehydrogenase E1 component [Aurantibacillus circumpalustris]|uniref:2-oxoglutarate dehydrogenase E1 component n=1 Tax=Aurantibacillus circumpalustris TaxID=3036359 RepID=UPI00295B8839|nr:2-oxoglutarate dehydrogenase E1 component [Aurantibacillus circumpalustris]